MPCNNNWIVAAFVNAHTNLTEFDESLKLLWRNNIDPSKVVLGLEFYGRSFTLQDPSCTAPGCPFAGGGPAGSCTHQNQIVGTLSFAEIETIIEGGATVTLNEAAAVKIVTWDGNWVSYDDAETLQTKVDYANKNCLGGTMVWEMSLDDSEGTASNALAGATSGTTFNVRLNLTQNPIEMCTLTACQRASDPECPVGQTSLLKTYGSCGAVSNQPSTPGTNNALLRRHFCCPSKNVPTCEFEAPEPSAGCSTPACPSDTVQALTASNHGTTNCPFTPQNFCCKASNQLTTRSLGCFWTDCGQVTASTCPSGTKALVSSTVGQPGSHASLVSKHFAV